MRKSFGAKPMLYPMPVLIIGTYDENGVANAMNAAWGGISESTEISICVDDEHKTIANVLKNDFAAEKIDESENTKINESENNAMAELLTNLDNAQLNGLLDRVYHREITYQIGTLLSMEHEAYTSTKISGLKSALETSMNNLNQLYEQFQNFTSN